MLERQVDGLRSPITLDVIGHSTRDHHLLRLGDTAIDMLDTRGARFFRSIADDHLLSRLEVVAVRLLARTLRIPVFGAIKPLMKSHYDKLGFDPAFTQVLAEASELV